MSQSKIAGAQTSSRAEKMVITGSVLALALGSGLGATPAEAALIVHDLDVLVPFDSSYSFGIVGDEFTIASNAGAPPFISLTGNATALSTNFVAVKDSSPTTLRSFTPGETVDGTATFATSGSDALPFLLKPVDNIFYGLKTVGLEDPYGWVQLDYLGNGDLHLDAFAFEDNKVDGAPISGDPVDLPEPGTLGMFAVGSAALLAARRRKKQKAA